MRWKARASGKLPGMSVKTLIPKIVDTPTPEEAFSVARESYKADGYETVCVISVQLERS